MSATLDLFNRWKAAQGFDSDRAAAHALGISHGAPHHWRQGRNGSASLIERMSKDLGEDPVPVILQAFAEAARDADDRRTLGKLAKRLGAACVALVTLVPLLSAAPRAEAMQAFESERAIHYAHFIPGRIQAHGMHLGVIPRRPLFPVS